MKAKLEERQEKVKVHERQVKESARLESCSLTSASIAVGIEEDATCLTPAGTVMDSMCLMPAGTVVDSTCPKPAMPHDSVISDDVFMGEWATSQAMPACAVGHDMLSSSVPLGDTHWSEVIDQAAFFNSNDMTTTLSPAELFCALDTQHASQGPPGRATSCSASGALPTFGLENSFYPPQNLHDSSLNREAQHRFTAYAADMPQDEDRWDVDVPASAQERIRYIVDRATAVGFDTFDEAVAAYYTKKFEDTSLLCVDQRLSRNQQLPQLLSTLHNAAKDWSEWERRGFQEQIIQNAEEALVEELSSYITRRPMRASNTGSTKNHFRGEKYGSGIDFKRRREIQDDVSTHRFAYSLQYLRLVAADWD